MKQPKPNFVVEYKGARKKAAMRSTSIWGSVDLRQFSAHDAEMESSRIGGQPAISDPGRPVATPHVLRAAKLAEDPQKMTTSSLALEEQMADDTSMTEQASTEPEIALPKAPEPKKRGPRAKKVAPETAASDVSVEAPPLAKTRAKRGTKNALAEVKPSNRRPGRKAKAAVEKVVGSATKVASPITGAGEEMEDLLQLEQENQRLRKLLAQKLREENAGLRKRLGFD